MAACSVKDRKSGCVKMPTLRYNSSGLIQESLPEKSCIFSLLTS